MSILFNMSHIKKIKKHPYLLLELLIAFTLLAIFLGPMLGAPLSHLKKMKAEILDLYLNIEGEKILFSVEERIRTGEIPWDVLFKNNGIKTFFASPENSETLTSLEKNHFPPVKSKIYLSRKAFKKDKNGLLIGTVQITVEFYTSSKKKVLHRSRSLLFVSRKELQPLPQNSTHLASKHSL